MIQNKIDELFETVKNSKEYKAYQNIGEVLKNNDEINDLVNEIKKLQQESVRLEEENNPKLRLQWREDGEIYADKGGYSIVIFANDRSEAQCRKIACDKVAAYRAREELF